MSRVLNSRPECSGPLIEALRPLKNAILSQSLGRLHQIVEQHDFAAIQNSVFVDKVCMCPRNEFQGAQAQLFFSCYPPLKKR